VPLRLSDGGDVLDFVAPVRVTPVTLPRLGFRLLRGTLARDGAVLAGSGLAEFEVRCDEPLPLQLDGEDIGDVTEARFEAEPDALTVLV
jgi:diacylglycerol kinase family enzyme